MNHFADERDYNLLENDKYTFFVLDRIMGGECDLASVGLVYTREEYRRRHYAKHRI